MNHISTQYKLKKISAEIEEILRKRNKLGSSIKELELDNSFFKESPEDTIESAQTSKERIRQKLEEAYKSISLIAADSSIHVDHRNFHAHKVLLASKSKYFRHMLTKNFIENRYENKMDGISGNIFELILLYIYFEEDFQKIQPDELTAQEWITLFKYANYFMLDDLQALCGSKMASLITIENFYGYLRTSVDLNSRELELSCLKFVFERHFDSEVKKLLHQLRDNSHELIERIENYCHNKRFLLFQRGIRMSTTDTSLKSENSESESPTSSSSDEEFSELKSNSISKSS